MVFTREPAAYRNLKSLVSFRPSNAQRHFEMTSKNILSLIVAAIGAQMSLLETFTPAFWLVESSEVSSVPVAGCKRKPGNHKISEIQPCRNEGKINA